MYIAYRNIDYQYDTEQYSKHIGNIFGLLLVYGAIIIGLLALLGKVSFTFLFGSNLSLYPWGILTILTAFFNGIIKTYSSLLIFQQKSNQFFIINTSNFILIITCSIYLLEAFPGTLVGPIYGRLIPSIISACIVLVIVHKKYAIKLYTKYLKKIVLFTTPLVILSIFNWLIFNLDRFIILHYLDDPSYVGIFDIAIKISLVLDLLCIGISNSINPRVFDIIKKNNLTSSSEEVMKYFNAFLAIVMLFIPLLVLITPIVIKHLIINHIYYESFSLLMIISLGFIFRVHLFMYISPIYYFNKTKLLPLVYIIAALIQIPITITLVNHHGLIGAAWASLINKPILSILLYLFSRRVFKFKLNKIKQIYLPLFYLATILLINQSSSGMNINLNNLLSAAFSTIIISFVYRREIYLLLKHRLLHR